MTSDQDDLATKVPSYLKKVGPAKCHLFLKNVSYACWHWLDPHNWLNCWAFWCSGLSLSALGKRMNNTRAALIINAFNYPANQDLATSSGSMLIILRESLISKIQYLRCQYIFEGTNRITAGTSPQPFWVQRLRVKCNPSSRDIANGPIFLGWVGGYWPLKLLEGLD